MIKLRNISALLLVCTAVLFAACTGDIEPYEGTIPGVDTTPTTPANPTNGPVLTTTAISNVSNTSAASGGTVTSDGGSPVTARGVVWSTSQNPTIANSKTTNGAGIGSFVSSITGLTAQTTYYVRAYATNGNGTSYGSQISFTTTTTTLTPSTFMAGIFNGASMSNMRPAWYGGTGAFSNQDEVMVVYEPSNNDRYLKLQGEGLNQLELNLYIPQTQWAVGTYTLFDHNFYSSPNCNGHILQPMTGVYSHTIISGTITITEFNLVTKKMRGTFSFQYKNNMNDGSTDPGPYQVTNGTLDYNLNATYFN